MQLIKIHLISGSTVERVVDEDAEKLHAGIGEALGSVEGSLTLPAAIVPVRNISHVEILTVVDDSEDTATADES